MTRINYSVMFASVVLLVVVPLLASAKPAANLLAAACERNPSLSMCAGAASNSEDSAFRAADAPMDEDTRFMRSFPKMDFDELQINRYCSKHQNHYTHYCVGNGEVSNKLADKIAKFCPSFEKYCPDLANKLVPAKTQPKRRAVAAGVPFVIPPPLPSAGSGFGGLAFDSPMPARDSTPVDSVPERAPETALSPAMIETCTPDCTAPHCTTECKCANTHPSVHAKCNPPSNAAMAGVCQSWYAKCPMFKPVSY
uniref:CX9C domain-containing protein n=1 Tax=Panagrellus redivivus TaxID=6233 RepID=A0A7E4ZRJ9_PANRE